MILKIMDLVSLKWQPEDFELYSQTTIQDFGFRCLE
jgi:hypothetical protein